MAAMEPQSPPKRMTRARAAKTSGTDTASASASSTTRLSKTSTASSRAKAARSARATTSATGPTTKRKLRAEDLDSDSDEDELGLDRPATPVIKPARAARGRPKRVVSEQKDDSEPEPAAPATATATVTARAPRGRPPKKAASAKATAGAPASSSATGPTRSSRAKRTDAGAVVADHVAEAAPKVAKAGLGRPAADATRTASGTTTATRVTVRTAASTAAVTSRAAAAKKRVTFEEPEKENMIPHQATAKGKAPVVGVDSESKTTSTTGTGLRAKPLRRAAATTSASAGKTTLSGQASKMASTASGSSTGALASAGSQPAKATDRPQAPLSPKKVTQVRMARDFDVESEDELGAMDSPAYIKPLLRSPTKPVIRRVPEPAPESDTARAGAGAGALPLPEPPAGMLASPARRPKSPVKDMLIASPARRLEGLSMPSADVPQSTAKPLTAKASVLFSPAKRFPVAPKAAACFDDTTCRSPFKMSLLQTPAKRPASPVKAAILLQKPDLRPSCLAKVAIAGDTALPPGTQHPSEEAESDETGGSHFDEDDGASEAGGDSEASVAEEDPESLTQMLKEMETDAAEAETIDSPSRKSRRNTRRLSKGPVASASPALVQTDTEDAGIDNGGDVGGEVGGDAVFEDEDAAADESVLLPGEPMDLDLTLMATGFQGKEPLPKKQQLPTPAGLFSLRAKDLVSYDTESDLEDDTTALLSMDLGHAPETPCPAQSGASNRTPSTRAGRTSEAGSSTAKRLRMTKFGFTPLAEQLGGWKAHSPAKKERTPSRKKHIDIREDKKSDEETGQVQQTEKAEPEQAPEPEQAGVEATSEDESANEQADAATALPEVHDAGDAPMAIFDDIQVTQEDLDLASEANEMSLMETEPMQEEPLEDSQEYGDENDIPIDPVLLAASNASSPGVPPITPQRTMTRTFHTVSKVPLKAADDSTPSPMIRRRSLNVSRLPTSVRRSSTGGNGQGPDRSSSATSYSPSKKETRRESRRMSSRRDSSRRESFGGALAVAELMGEAEEAPDAETAEAEQPEEMTYSTPMTPAKSEGGWSTVGTPARTPRRDLDPGLLRGAVVFVDVHTTEGADASGIFVELLTQMGARCVKTWSWNPSSSPSETEKERSGSSSASSRIGITHVVFKDGGKRTIEKVRESGGVVQCVGVSWVLDCERENQWLDEAPYCIDTSMVPRGGARRRKSMEPRALANLNGVVVSTPVKQMSTASSSFGGRDCYTAPANRRESALWVRSPVPLGGYSDDGSEHGDDADADGDPDWDMVGMLTPVPRTPAPEAIARYAANLPPATPTMNFGAGGNYSDDGLGDDDDDDYHNDDAVSSAGFGKRAALMTRTCPQPKRAVSMTVASLSSLTPTSSMTTTAFGELGEGILAREKDERVLMRLMAARRKSLQFAPKVGSPLAKAWK